MKTDPFQRYGRLARSDTKSSVARKVTPSPAALRDLAEHSQEEARYHALGRSDEGRVLHLTFTLRGPMIRVISARDASRKERAVYEQAD